MLERLDVVCRVVDHYGDAGFCWRLARQLVAEHALDVRLWIDDLAPLARIAPVDAEGETQRALGVEIRRLREDAPPVPLPEAVVAGFGARLPDAWIDAMAACRTPPPWIHLEYLSAEAWVDGAHGLPSPPPRHPALRRWFFVPGFTPSSGGLLRERGLLAARDAFAADAAAQERLWRALGLPTPAHDELAVSLFCYANAALPALFDAWSAGAARVRLVVPEGIAEDALARWCGQPIARGDTFARGALAVAVAPFVLQDAFDRRLWTCGLNVVRGEDSFVRAQWAARPLVWQPYRQDGGAHGAKLDAFLARHLAGAPAAEGEALATFVRAFHREDGAAAAGAWPALRDALPALGAHAARWADALAAQRDLATQLVEFIRFRL